jgi:uncharacterized protein (TIRG00374 family)
VEEAFMMSLRRVLVAALAVLQRYLRLLVGLIVAVLTLYFLAKAVEGLRLQDVGARFAQANYWWILPGVGFYFLAVAARTWRWHYLLRPLKRIPLGELFPMVVIGYMGNNIYPARAGEVLRSYVLRRRDGVPISASLATVFVERIFDGVVMLMFVFAGLPLVPVPDWLRQVVVLGSLGFFGALAVFLVLAARPAAAARLAGWFTTRLVPARLHDQVATLVERFLHGLASLRRPQDVLMVFVTTVVIWLTETVKYYFVMFAFGFEVSFFALMLMNGVVNLATTIPTILPGYVGTFDVPGIEVLKQFGVAPDTAVAYTVVLHAALWLPVTLLGLWYMAREGLSWRRVAAEVEGEERVPAGELAPDEPPGDDPPLDRSAREPLGKVEGARS